MLLRPDASFPRPDACTKLEARNKVRTQRAAPVLAVLQHLTTFPR
jgi:hypothetical protein